MVHLVPVCFLLDFRGTYCSLFLAKGICVMKLPLIKLWKCRKNKQIEKRVTDSFLINYLPNNYFFHICTKIGFGPLSQIMYYESILRDKLSFFKKRVITETRSVVMIRYLLSTWGWSKEMIYLLPSPSLLHYPSIIEMGTRYRKYIIDEFSNL